MVGPVFVLLVGCGGGSGNSDGGATSNLTGTTPGSTPTPTVVPQGGKAAVEIKVSGLPADATPSITLFASDGYAKTLNGPATLVDVPPGAYAVGASLIVDGALRYSPTISGAPGTLAAGGATSVTVSFAFSFVIDDTLYTDQWHLKNTGQPGPTGVPGLAGADINVEPVWKTRALGKGAAVAVVDNGLELAHEDLSANVLPGRSFNYANQTTDPTGAASDSTHGTSVAGIIAARDNGRGVVGVAPRAGLVGLNALVTGLDSDIADAMTRDLGISASNNSWGAQGAASNIRGSQISPAPQVWRSAIETGLTQGRSGKGIVYVYSAGNSGSITFTGVPTFAENSNLDGYASHRGVISVGALNDRGEAATYTEPGANIWISAPGGAACDSHGITTTDRAGALGFNSGASAVDYGNANYSKCFAGTSASVPIVAGVVALVLEANPNLSWRDVRLVLARSARKTDAANPEWAINAAGLNVHPRFGFGAVDAKAAVDLAKTWPVVGPQLTVASAVDAPNLAIPDNDATGVSRSISVAPAGIGKVEWVEVTFSAGHTFWGDLEVDLTSPAGTVSRLTNVHRRIVGGTYSDHVFGSARHLDEAAGGTWKLTVRDRATGFTGTFQSWSLRLYGRSS